ncbi:unnamed protein product [Pieris brassicae]|uniref:Ig-like domain-containing protein n=1 Tax=Pieris brassicae TaxID=7116 RepID=A0A9P0TK85_PIEBR|nr:unnamed protein product [Pieris brassicae]
MRTSARPDSIRAHTKRDRQRRRIKSDLSLGAIIQNPPEITIRPRNLQVRANGIAAFYCAARGDPKPNIQWRKNGKRVSSMQSRYQVSGMDKAAGPAANGAVLRIEPVRAQRDDATYECVAENGVGDAVTALATLTVFERFIASITFVVPHRVGSGTKWVFEVLRHLTTLSVTFEEVCNTIPISV